MKKIKDKSNGFYEQVDFLCKVLERCTICLYGVS